MKLFISTIVKMIEDPKMESRKKTFMSSKSSV